MSAKDVVEEIKKLNTKKVLKIVKKNTDIFGSYLRELVSDRINKGIFPDILKYANITLLFKKLYRGFKEDYLPVPPCKYTP